MSPHIFALILQIESLHTLISHDVLSAALTICAGALGFMVKEYRADRKSREVTRVKANLSFDDLTDRRPEMQRHFDALMEHGWGRR